MPGLKDFFKLLRERQIPFILATNNARMTADQYVAKLAKMGVTISTTEVLTSGMATALYLAQRTDPATSRVFVIGECGAYQPLLELGFTLTDLYEITRDARAAVPTSPGADFVVCGLDREITWDKLATATLNIRAGAKFIGTNGDTTLPTEHGITHGNGAILAALQAATGVAPTIIGKPEPIMYQLAIAKLGADPAKTIAIGDRLNTDILGAVRTGIRSLLVLSGISTEQELQTTDYQPTWIMPDIRAVTKALQN